MDYEVDEMSAASPDMTETELAALTASIRRLGQLVPVVVAGNRVIDGRKRLRACQELGIEPRVVRIDATGAADRAEALNLLRTHYNASQRAAYFSRLATLRPGVREDRQGGSIDPSTEVAASPPVSAETAAELAGVSRPSIIRAHRVRRITVPEVMAAVEAGELTLHAAKKIADAVPLEHQAQAVAEAVAARRKAKARGGRAPTGGVRVQKSKPSPKRLTNAINQLQVIGDAFKSLNVAECRAADPAERRRWVAEIATALQPIRRFARRLAASGAIARAI